MVAARLVAIRERHVSHHCLVEAIGQLDGARQVVLSIRLVETGARELRIQAREAAVTEYERLRGGSGQGGCEEAGRTEKLGAARAAADTVVACGRGFLFFRASQTEGQVQALRDVPRFVGKQGKASGGLCIAVVVAGAAKGGAGQITSQLRY